MDRHQGFVVGVSRRGRPIEGSSNHFFVVDHSELVVELVAPGEAWGADSLLLPWYGRNRSGMLRTSPHLISKNPSQNGMNLAMRLPRAKKGYWINGSGLAFEGCQP